MLRDLAKELCLHTMFKTQFYSRFNSYTNSTLCVCIGSLSVFYLAQTCPTPMRAWVGYLEEYIHTTFGN